MEPYLSNKIPCKYCEKYIDPRGMMSHVHFKHVDYVVREFALNPWVTMFLYGRLPVFKQLQLPAPTMNYHTFAVIYYMLAPVDKVPKWINEAVSYESKADEKDAISLLTEHLKEKGYAPSFTPTNKEYELELYYSRVYSRSLERLRDTASGFEEDASSEVGVKTEI